MRNQMSVLHFPPGLLCDTDVNECDSSPCHHGGLCTQIDDAGFTCSCPSGISGPTCRDVRTANFNGFHVLKLPSLAQLARAEGEGKRRRKRREAGSSGMQIRFTFTTTVPRGLLLFASGVCNQLCSWQGRGARGKEGGRF